MSTTKKPAKTGTPEEHQAALQAMIAQGKKEGMIRAADLNAQLEKLQLTPEKIEEIYDVVRVSIILETLGVLSPAILVLLVTAVANNFWDEAKEGQFFIISGDALMARIVELSSAVEIQDVAKDVWVTVKKILLSLRMVEKVPL